MGLFSKDDFAAESPELHGGGGKRDERFVGMSKDGGPGCFGEGDNLFMLLPPFANYIERATRMKEEAQAAGKKVALPIANSFWSLRVKQKEKKYPVSYRVSQDNVIVNAFRAIYEEMKESDGKMGDELKAIQKHMGGFGEERAVANVYLSNALDKILWLNAPISLIEKFVKLIPKLYERMPNDLYFDLEQTAILRLELAYSGTIPQIQHATVDVARDANDHPEITSALKMMTSRVEGFTEEMLDGALEWSKQVDDADLPPLSAIPALAAHGQACEILKKEGFEITTHGAATNSSQVAAGGLSGADFGADSAKEEKPAEKKEETKSAASAFGADDSSSTEGEQVSTLDQTVEAASDAFSAQLEAAERESGASDAGGDADAGGFPKM
jgi:hypothetical protein